MEIMARPTRASSVELWCSPGISSWYPPEVIRPVSRTNPQHPSCPSSGFGGKGAGPEGAQAVLTAAHRESGATVHLVDEVYDHGAALAQVRVPVLPGDTAGAVGRGGCSAGTSTPACGSAGCCEGGTCGGVKESPVPKSSRAEGSIELGLGTGDSRLTNMPRALISVSDKRGVVAFARGLADMGWEIISTGGTAAVLRSGDVPVIEVEKLTGFPELLDGRVKRCTHIHGALLARRDLPKHVAALERQKIAADRPGGGEPLSLSAHHFQQNASLEDALENIDVGGPSMLRSPPRITNRYAGGGSDRLSSGAGNAPRGRGGPGHPARVCRQGFCSYLGLRFRHCGLSDAAGRRAAGAGSDWQWSGCSPCVTAKIRPSAHRST